MPLPPTAPPPLAPPLAPAQYGVRGVLGLRSSLQQLCKAALDGMHAKQLSKLTSERGLLA